MAYTNAQVIAVLRQIDQRLARIESRTGTPVGTPEVTTVVAESPVVIPERGEKVTRLALRCKGGVSRACEREFGSQANLDAHNAWAHKA